MSDTAEKTEIKLGQPVEVHPEQLPQAQVSEANGLMSLVERMAVAPDIDPDRVERAFEMYKQVRAMDAEAAFNEAMARAQSEIQSVVVNKQGYKNRYSYADLSQIHEHAKPIWTKHGFSVVTKTGRSDLDKHIKVFCDVKHSMGHKEHHEDDWPLDTAGSEGGVNKTAIQGKGSTTSYARRYTECMIFDIAIKGEDDDGGTVKDKKPAEQPINDQQLKNLRKAMVVAGATDADVCKKAQIENIEDLQQGRLKGCMDWLQQKAQS